MMCCNRKFSKEYNCIHHESKRDEKLLENYVLSLPVTDYENGAKVSVKRIDPSTIAGANWDAGGQYEVQVNLFLFLS